MMNITYALYLTLVSGTISNTQEHYHIHINNTMMVDHWAIKKYDLNSIDKH